MSVTLYSYWRSSTSYRVRIALGLKGISYETVEVDLRTGAHRDPSYRRINAFGSLPALRTDQGETVVQSLAIFTWLDHYHPSPALWPADPVDRVKAEQLSFGIACDLHAVNNLRILKYLKQELSVGEDAVTAWYGHWVDETFEPIEAMLKAMSLGESLPFGEPGAFEAILVPQVYNAQRFGVGMAPYAEITRINDACLALDAFRQAAPEEQPAAAT